jgi:hypothetical protein
MTVYNLDNVLAAQKYAATWMKTGTRTTVAVTPFTTAGVAGNPAGTLNVGNTANGIVPTDDGTEGPALPTFSNSAYLSKVIYGSTVACTMRLYDRLWAAGAYSYNTDTTLASVPSFSGRIPTGGYFGLELWVEAVTAMTGALGVQVNYYDQEGDNGDTGVVAAALPSGAILGRMGRIPLASGDSGIQGFGTTTANGRIRGSTASGGTFNISVMRPLWAGRVNFAGAGGVDDMLKTGLPQIYPTSCLWVVLETDSTAVGLPYMNIQVIDA